MEKRLLLIILLVVSFYGCRKEKPQAAAAMSPDFQKAMAFEDKQNDSAFYYFNKATGNSKDSLLIARAYNNMAEIQTDAGDYFGSQETLTTSLKFLNKRKPSSYHCLTADYNELGMTSLRLRNYDAAIGFYDHALKFTADNQLKAIIQNNQGNARQQQKAYNRAIQLYRTAIQRVGTTGTTYARILANLAYTQWLRSPGYNAAPEMSKALQLRRQAHDLWGEMASDAHLADYYTASKPDSGLRYAQTMYQLTRQLNSPDDELEALQKLVRLGQPLDAKRYFTRYQLLTDSLGAARNAAKNQFAFIRYDAEKNKADYLRSQKENVEEQYQIARQKVILIGSVLAFIAVTILITYGYRRRKRKDQLRLSNKVHSRVANGLYQLMQEVDNGHTLDKEVVVSQLNILYERSRNISHEPIRLTQDNFAGEVGRLLTGFTGNGINLAIIDNNSDCWKNIAPSLLFALEEILQEWMVNMKKHSQATNVGVRFERTGDWLDIYYTDNGVGFPTTMTYGKGLQNTENRIKRLGGQVIFDTKLDKGVKIHLSLPLS